MTVGNALTPFTWVFTLVIVRQWYESVLIFIVLGYVSEQLVLKDLVIGPSTLESRSLIEGVHPLSILVTIKPITIIAVASVVKDHAPAVSLTTQVWEAIIVVAFWISPYSGNESINEISFDDS